MGPPTPAPAAPPTNQFGQPIRGILPPERAPEDPNRVMEQFGRGSPEHIQALQRRCVLSKSQSVAQKTWPTRDLITFRQENSTT